MTNNVIKQFCFDKLKLNITYYFKKRLLRLLAHNQFFAFLRVTELVIKKPDTFRHSAGDWVFIKVPQIAQFEWHPFTISSAPERRDAFTLHIRGVGTWTNRLFKYFEEIKAKSGRELRSQSIRYIEQFPMKESPENNIEEYNIIN